MKKPVTVLLTLLALMMLISCEVSKSDKEVKPVITGCWKLIKSSYTNGTFQRDMDRTFSSEYLCLNDDGTYELLIPDLECAGEAGTYSIEGDVLNLFGDPVDYGCGDLKILTKTASDLKIRWNFYEDGSGYHDFTFIKQQ